MKTAESLDGHDPAGTQKSGCLFDRIAIERIAGHIAQMQLRATVRAAGGFGMKTTVSGIGVFACAVRTERKRRKTGLRPVVGQATRHGIAWPAMGAGDKSVPPASTFRVAHFREAIGTGSGVVSNGCYHPPANTVDDLEVFTPVGGAGCPDHRIHPRQWGGIRFQARDEDFKLLALGMNFDPRRVIADPAGELQFLRELPDEGTKTDALNDARDPDTNSRNHL